MRSKRRQHMSSFCLLKGDINAGDSNEPPPLSQKTLRRGGFLSNGVTVSHVDKDFPYLLSLWLEKPIIPR
jgi:hypothetical protein